MYSQYIDIDRREPCLPPSHYSKLPQSTNSVLKLLNFVVTSTLPKISERFDKGQLSFSKVRAITRIADASNEDYLLMIADHGTAHHVEKLVSKYRTAKRLQDADIVRAQYNNREMTHYYDHNGCLVIKARLPAEQGALIVKALEMAMDVQFHDNVTAVTSESESEAEVVPIAARRGNIEYRRWPLRLPQGHVDRGNIPSHCLR